MTPQLHASLRDGFQNKLTATQRRVLLLHRVDHLSMREIACVLDMTEERVASVYHSALGMLSSVVHRVRMVN